jgi:2-succinyl-5-enolpyruvyl-6-hydroxy-3-cyclohexene-1-carboxylate synthase
MDSLWDQQRYRERLDLHYRWSFLWGRGIKIKHFKKENTSSQEINIHARHTHTHTSHVTHTQTHTDTHTHTSQSEIQVLHQSNRTALCGHEVDSHQTTSYTSLSNCISLPILCLTFSSISSCYICIITWRCLP